MKQSIFYCLIIVFLFSSCKQINDNKNLKKTETKAISQSTDTLPSCFSSSQIYTETAVIWQASWVTYYDKYGNGSENYTQSPQLHFDENNLNSLYLEVLGKDYPGVILWYILLDKNDSIPSLAMQNTASCIIDEGGTILMSPGNKTGVVKITEDSLKSYKEKWLTESANNQSVHTAIEAYNYSWKSLNGLMDQNSAPDGIFINYGLRTIEPGEIG